MPAKSRPKQPRRCARDHDADRPMEQPLTPDNLSLHHPDRDRLARAYGLTVAARRIQQEQAEVAPVNIPDLSDLREIPDLAADILRRSPGWSLGERPVEQSADNNLARFLLNNGITLFFLPRRLVDLGPFSAWAEGRPTIFLDAQASAEDLRLTMAVEIGHLALDVRTLDHRQIGGATEHAAAERFGREFLIPRNQALGHDPSTWADLFGVSKELAAVTASEMLFTSDRRTTPAPKPKRRKGQAVDGNADRAAFDRLSIVRVIREIHARTKIPDLADCAISKNEAREMMGFPV